MPKDSYKVILRKLHNQVRLLDRDAQVEMFDQHHRWMIQQVLHQEALLRAFRIFKEQMNMVERQIRTYKIKYDWAWITKPRYCVQLIYKLNRKEFVSLQRRYLRSDIDNPIIEQLIDERRKVQQFMDNYLIIKRFK